MRIFVDDAEPWERDTFSHLAREHDVTAVEEPLDARNASAYREAEFLSTFICSKLGTACATANRTQRSHCAL